jgi:hypothetical protein
MRKSYRFAVLAVAMLLVFSSIRSGFVITEANSASFQSNTIFTSGTIKYTASSFLHTSGTKILNAANEEVVFNAISTMTLFNYEAYGVYPAIYSPNDMTIIRSHGLNLVRLDIQLNVAVYGVPTSQQTPTSLTYNPQFFTTLDALVNRCAQEGLWVNICFGTSDGTWAPIGGVFGMGNGFPTWMYDGSWSYFNKIYPNTVDGRDSAIRDFWNIYDPSAVNVRTAYQTFWKDIASHFRNSPNVIFGLYNEPECQWGGNTPIWSNQTLGAETYKTFIEETIDIIRNVAPNNLIFQNDAYFYSYTTNPKIDRPNLVVECHSYSLIDQNFVNLGWRYNQPFFLGEFGGIEEGLQTRSDTITNMQFCNTLGVSRSYLSYRPSNGYPSTQTWIDLQTYLITNIKYYSAA